MEKNIFDQVAKKYDTEKQIKLAEIIVEEVKQELNNSKSKSLLDYGSGTGLVGLELSNLVDSVLLVDSSEQMVEIIKNKIFEKEISNTKALQADFMKDTPDVKADIVVMSLVLLHIPDTKMILERLYNILNENSKLLIIDFDKNELIHHPMVHNGFYHEELEEMLSGVGFKSTEIRTFYHGTRVFMNEDASMFIASSTK